MISFRHYILLLILFVSFKSYTQNNTIDKIGVGNGLSNNNILSIAQDEDGFMWFGTEWGLNRFDGTSFKVYKADTSKNTISHNGINKILVDSVRHLIWIATKGGGLNVLNRSSEEFIHYPTYEQTPNSTHSNGITDLCFDENGDIWIATYNNGLKKLNIETNTISHNLLRNIPISHNFRIKCIADDQKGNLYIGHWGQGFSVMSTKDFKGKYYKHDPDNPNSLPGNEVMDICIDSKNRIWLGTHNGLALYNPLQETFTVFTQSDYNPNGLSDHDIYSLNEIDNQLWIGTWHGGVNILNLESVDINNPENNKFEHIEANDLPSGLSSPSIEDIFKDSFGNIWMGTAGEGINVINHVKPFFKQLVYSSIKEEQNGLSSKTVHCLAYSPDSLLWVGLNNGYVDIFKKNNKTDNFQKQKSLFLSKDITYSLADSNGNLWFANNVDGLIYYNLPKETIEKVDVFRNSSWNKFVAAIYEDRDQNIWVSANDGIIKYNPKNHDIKAFNGETIGLNDKLIRNIIQDINGNYWISSAINGVSVVTEEFKLIYNFNENNVLKSNNINHIYEDSENQIWVCTNNGASVFPHIKDHQYDAIHINEAKGLKDNYARAIVEGKKGEMWISTNAGISKYIIHSDSIKNYGYNDGIPLGTFRNASVTKTNDGTILFGSQDGLCYFNPHDSIVKKVLPPTVITGLQVYDSKEDLPFKSINLPVNQTCHLTHTQNSISINFNVLDYGLRNKVEYAYLLKGVDDDTWYQTQMQNNVTFRNLSPGSYTFFVKARMHNQEWSDKIDHISFRIYPPVYLSWWAKLLYTCMAILIVVAIIIFYRRKLKLENQLQLQQQSYEQEQELNKERMQFFTNVTHELRTPLTLILGPLEEMVNSNKRRDAEDTKMISLIQKNATRLLTLINQLLEFRKNEAQSRQLSVTQEDITILLQEIVLKYKDLNKNKEVSIDLFIEDSIVLYFDKEAITIIMDNLISNALKNTKKGSVQIIVRTITINEVAILQIKVKDTGLGIPEGDLNKIFDRYFQVKRTKQIAGTGIGLALVKKLVQLHEGTMDVKSKLQEGTTFSIQLKLEEQYPDAIHIKSQKKPKIEKKEFSKRMLIVEDNEEINEYISDIFSQSFEIITAFDGQDALSKASDSVPDIIISDIMMPVMDGIEFCKQLKKDISTSHIPVILLTAKDSEVDKTEGYSIGADSYLTKPFSAALLKTRVNNLLEGRNKIASYFKSEVYKKDLSSNSMAKMDNEFINQTITIIEENLGAEKIDIAFLAKQQNMSYTSFSRKVKAITGSTANDFVKDIKLQKAEQLLISRKYSISEVAFMVGYNSLAYFREAFKTKFGVLPSEYISNLE